MPKPPKPLVDVVVGGRVFALIPMSQVIPRATCLAIIRSPVYWENLAAYLKKTPEERKAAGQPRRLTRAWKRCIVAYLRRCDRAEKAQA